MTLNVAIIGSGFGGLAASVKLRNAGIDNFVMFERASELGGTWRDNTYPGCRCDVASNLYSLSFARNPNWSNSFSYQPEIQQYLLDVAKKFKLRDLIKFNHEVLDITYNHSKKLWDLKTNHGDFEARNVILAAGGLAEARLPNIDGIESFAGQTMHTARWDSSVDLKGKRIAVIGTGASAVQMIPEIVPIAAHVDVFQRTASWILPHMQGHPVKKWTTRTYRYVPGAQWLVRWAGYWRRELLGLAFTKKLEKLQVGMDGAKQFRDLMITDPVLNAKLTPDYTMGCKRILITNYFYPAIAQPNVDLITEGIDRIESNGVRTKDGVLHEAEVLICATGFYVTDSPVGKLVHGLDGALLADSYLGDMPNYLGSSFSKFPNLFMMGGPNTSLGHNSIVFMHESQLNYIVPAIKYSLKKKAVVSPKEANAIEWTKAIRAKTSSTVWGTGCKSWYLNASGENTTVWPDQTFRFRKSTRGFKKQDHDITV